ncbi:sensor histidine kinase [Thalassotalea euphylliae]|uniref:sensor histidine kinase n=1 Tax=Thalassotalea euphylliae TaxID=1655234 RepID=UPI003635B612
MTNKGSGNIRVTQFPQKTAWFFLPWLLWVLTLVAIFFAGEKEQPWVWAVCAGYALSLLLINREKLYLNSADSAGQIALSATPFIIDLCFYGVILLFHDGASNGGVSVLYLPVIVAAMQVRRRVAWLVTGLAIAIYSGLMMQGHAAHFEHLSASFASHLSGMWLTFSVSTVLITWFVTQQRQAIVTQEQQIHQLRERQLRDEQILTLATVSANTTHRLATPLSTAKLLVDELNQDKQFDQTIVDDLSAQIDTCHATVHTIAKQSREHQTTELKTQPAKEFIEQTLQYWWVSRNDVQYQLSISKALENKTLMTDFNLQMSLTNLLENAAFASLANNHSDIDISVDIANIDTSPQLVINIDDKGQGIAPELLDQLGHRAVSSKTKGMGMGLALANATIERFNGELRLFNLTQGSRSQVSLPLA